MWSQLSCRLSEIVVVGPPGPAWADSSTMCSFRQHRRSGRLRLGVEHYHVGGDDQLEIAQMFIPDRTFGKGLRGSFQGRWLRWERGGHGERSLGEAASSELRACSGLGAATVKTEQRRVGDGEGQERSSRRNGTGLESAWGDGGGWLAVSAA